MLKSNGFHVSPAVLPDVDKTVLTTNLPTTQAMYKMMDVDTSKVLETALTFSLTLDTDVKLTDYNNFISILKNTYKEQVTGKQFINLQSSIISSVSPNHLWHYYHTTYVMCTSYVFQISLPAVLM